MVNNRFLLFCIVLLSLFSCDNRHLFFEKNVIIDSGTWDRAFKPSFEIEVSDSLAHYNFFFNLRNSGDYSYSNLWIFLHTTTPDGIVYKDTLECPLADHSGKWLGTSASGGMWDNRVLFKANSPLKQLGKYTFVIEQAMRDESLENIYDIGLRIEFARNF